MDVQKLSGIIWKRKNNIYLFIFFLNSTILFYLLIIEINRKCNHFTITKIRHIIYYWSLNGRIKEKSSVSFKLNRLFCITFN